MTNPAPARSPLSQALSSGVEALARGKQAEACEWALRAVHMDPLSEDAWLLLAAVAPPSGRVAYLDHLLKIHPESEGARQARAELSSHASFSVEPEDGIRIPSVEEILSEGKSAPPPEPSDPVRQDKPLAQPAKSEKTPREYASKPVSPPGKRKGIFCGKGFRWAAILLSVSCLLALTATAFAGVVTSAQEPPVLARVVKEQSAIPPTFTPSFTPTITASFTPTFTSTFTPSPTYTATNTRIPTSTPWPEVYYVPGSGGERWIDVDISAQQLVAYEGNSPVRSFIVSTGVAAHPTVLGRYHIYVKLRYDLMAGPGYYLPNVPYVMYFYQGYSIHGTYWHHNFGTPMSHGCVNMSIPDAEWVYYWASVGTLVNVHW
jgi:lipoprotein-anchoring transpeptidase ErfK/SrfK